MKKRTFCIIAALFFSIDSLAQDLEGAGRAMGYMGVMGGVSAPDSTDTTSRMIFGLNGGTRLLSGLTLGGYYMRSTKKETISTENVPFDYSLFGFEHSFRYQSFGEGAYLGFHFGSTRVSTERQGEKVQTNPIHYGLQIGYDHYFANSLSFGLKGIYSLVNKSEHTLTTGNVEKIDSFQIVNFLVHLKFWF